MHPHWKPLHPLCSWSGYGPANYYNVLKCCVVIQLGGICVYVLVLLGCCEVMGHCLLLTFREKVSAPIFNGSPSDWLLTNVTQYPSRAKTTEPRPKPEISCSPVRSWSGCLMPGGFHNLYYANDPSVRTMALGSTQPLTEMSTRNISWA
jgi:hypothetical protein